MMGRIVDQIHFDFQFVHFVEIKEWNDLAEWDGFCCSKKECSSQSSQSVGADVPVGSSPHQCFRAFLNLVSNHRLSPRFHVLETSQLDHNATQLVE